MATILLVEDEEPIRDLLAQFLSDGGHRVVRAIHGAHALDLVEEERPDLVISDIMMPVLSGTELCRRLKARPGSPKIPVILMSAAGTWMADGTGADAFISKPFDLGDMQALVRRWSPQEGFDQRPGD
jgi:CheY-like chemotaxis protein